MTFTANMQMQKTSAISVLILLSATLVYYSNNLMNANQANTTIDSIKTELLPSEKIPVKTSTKDAILLA